MENSRAIYKRVKITWWLIIPFGGFHLRMIIAYIYQTRTNPISNSEFILFTTIWIFIYIFLGRFKVIIDDNYAIFRSDVWIPVKILISEIYKVSAKRVPLFDHYTLEKNCKKFYFSPFLKEALRIQLKSGKIYQIAIKNAEKIKEEIETRMIKT